MSILVKVLRGGKNLNGEQNLQNKALRNIYFAALISLVMQNTTHETDSSCSLMVLFSM